MITEAPGNKTEKNKTLLIMTTKSQSEKPIISRIGFYSECFPSKEACIKNPTGFYASDSRSTSVLFNLIKKTVHRLKEEKYAIGYNPHLLLSIGKCDMVMSGFNVENLCYFPVSYGADQEGVCGSWESLCGGRKFSLLELEVFKFQRR